MMKYEEFKETVFEAVDSMVEGQVTILQVTKNNGVVKDALLIKNRKSNISPLIYLVGYYEQYSKGENIENIISLIITLSKMDSGIDQDIVSNIKDLDKIRANIQMKLINKASNSVLLESVPYVDFLDLAIIFIIDIPCCEYRNRASITITNRNLQIWGIDKEKLYDIAKENCCGEDNYVVHNMKDIIRDLYIEIADVQEIDDEDVSAMLDSISDDKNALYVLTNQSKSNGAVTMTYENVIRDFANEKESNVYILPSSIHEVLLVAANEHMSKEQLREMVQSVNQTEVDEIEVLSDNVYYYDRELDKITIA